MANEVSYTPWMGSVTLTNANEVYVLSDLLALVPSPNTPYLGTSKKCQYLVFQFDPNGGAALWYVGNPGLSTTFHGGRLVAGQFYPWPISAESNLIRLDHVCVLCDTPGLLLHVCFLVR